ncbi:MAG: hypothetical protein ACXADY_12515 [Candidatus Hodarchaeales archaeon]
MISKDKIREFQEEYYSLTTHRKHHGPVLCAIHQEPNNLIMLKMNLFSRMKFV